MPDSSNVGDGDFYSAAADEPEVAVPRIVELVKTRIPNRFGLDPIRDTQVLCPMNRGGIGARSLNIELQAALNPAGERKVERFGWTFAPSDKVMQIEDDYDRRSTTATSGWSQTWTWTTVSCAPINAITRVSRADTQGAAAVRAFHSDSASPSVRHFIGPARPTRGQP